MHFTIPFTKIRITIGRTNDKAHINEQAFDALRKIAEQLSINPILVKHGPDVEVDEAILMAMETKMYSITSDFKSLAIAAIQMGRKQMVDADEEIRYLDLITKALLEIDPQGFVDEQLNFTLRPGQKGPSIPTKS